MNIKSIRSYCTLWMLTVGLALSFVCGESMANTPVSAQVNTSQTTSLNNKPIQLAYYYHGPYRHHYRHYRYVNYGPYHYRYRYGHCRRNCFYGYDGYVHCRRQCW